MPAPKYATPSAVTTLSGDAQPGDTHPADELAEVRAELDRLHLREARLIAALLRAEPAQRIGRFSRAEVAQSRRLTFEPARLPADLRKNPDLWREDICNTVEITNLATPQPRPGWPIRRATGENGALH